MLRKFAKRHLKAIDIFSKARDALKTLIDDIATERTRIAMELWDLETENAALKDQLSVSVLALENIKKVIGE